jgi:hypothetical protein
MRTAESVDLVRRHAPISRVSGIVCARREPTAIRRVDRASQAVRVLVHPSFNPDRVGAQEGPEPGIRISCRSSTKGLQVVTPPKERHHRRPCHEGLSRGRISRPPSSGPNDAVGRVRALEGRPVQPTRAARTRAEEDDSSGIRRRVRWPPSPRLSEWPTWLAGLSTGPYRYLQFPAAPAAQASPILANACPAAAAVTPESASSKRDAPPVAPAVATA